MYHLVSSYSVEFLIIFARAVTVSNRTCDPRHMRNAFVLQLFFEACWLHTLQGKRSQPACTLNSDG